MAHRDIQALKTLWYSFGPQGEKRCLTNSLGTTTASFTYTANGTSSSSC